MTIKHLNPWCEVHIPTDTRVLALSGAHDDGGNPAGFAASLSNGVRTDSSWKCSYTLYNDWMEPSFDDSHWPAAYEIGNYLGSYTIHDNIGLMRGAKNIWGVLPDSRSGTVFCRKTFLDDITLSITADWGCYNPMVNGLMLDDPDNWEWKNAMVFQIPGDTSEVAFNCLSKDSTDINRPKAGVIASLSNGVVTDSNWICTANRQDGFFWAYWPHGHWSAAMEVGQNPDPLWGEVNVSRDAKWIWTASDSGEVYCRINVPSYWQSVSAAEEQILIYLDVSESLEDYMSQVAGFIQDFYDITSTNGFFQTHNRKVTVATFNEGIVTSEEWALDYSKYNTGAELRADEEGQVAAIVDSIAAREAKGKTNIGKALQDAKQTYSLDQNWRVILVSDFLNTVDQPAISLEMAEYSNAGIKVVPVIVDKRYRREDTFHDVQTAGGGFGIDLSSDLDETAVSAIYNL